jgi:hypothetical protein
MKALITIGYQRFLLPSDKGLAGIMSALAKSTEVYSDHSHTCYGKDRHVVVKEGPVHVEVSLVPDKLKIVTLPSPKEEEPLGLPENGYRDPYELLGLPEHGTKPN